MHVCLCARTRVHTHTHNLCMSPICVNTKKLKLATSDFTQLTFCSEKKNTTNILIFQQFILIAVLKFLWQRCVLQHVTAHFICGVREG